MKFGVLFLFSCISLAWPAYNPGPVKNPGQLDVRVFYKGAVVKPKSIVIAKDGPSCGHGNREIVEVSVGAGQGLRNAVVFLEKVTAGKAWPDAKDGYVLDQKGCRFIPLTGDRTKKWGPTIMVVPNGQPLKVLNSDGILHNIHGYELIGKARRTIFNIAQPRFKKEVKKAVKTRRSPYVKLECDAHNFMHAFLFSPKNPYYALTGEKGTGAITDVPAGQYTAKAWHPKLGEKKKKVTVAGGQTAKIEFTF